MTAYPEMMLARELEICYANISMVTDHEFAVEGVEPVSGDTVMRVFAADNERLRELLVAAIPRIGVHPADACAGALERARVVP
jgi:5'-methylthioadenosine phosphorylase